MPRLELDIFKEVTAALEEAGYRDLVARLKQIELVDDTWISTGEAARILGVSSINTVKNWLEGGYFHGARQTSGGHWRFLRNEVEAMAQKIEELSAKNVSGELSPSESEAVEPPLL